MGAVPFSSFDGGASFVACLTGRSLEPSPATFVKTGNPCSLVFTGTEPLPVSFPGSDSISGVC
jgi:hypothetical protein